MNVYGCDFETDTDGSSNAWIVQYCITNGDKYWTGTSLEDFMSDAFKIMRKEKAYFYFHNLKFDLDYLKYQLYELRYMNIEIKAIIRKGNPVSIILKPPRSTGLHDLVIRDSAKKIDGDLKSLGKLVGLPKLEGFDFYPGWSQFVDFDDPNNWDYVKRDAQIVQKAMQLLHDQGHDHSTLSGDAWHEAKAILSTDSKGRTNLDRNYRWNKYFPKLNIRLDLELRNGYYGGVNISNNVGLVEGPITHADVNSMYPTVMTYDPLPYGIPGRTTRCPSKRTLYIMHACFKFNLKEGKYPWFLFKTALSCKAEGLKTNEPIVNCKSWHELYLTSVDLQTLSETYDITVNEDEIIEYFTFKSKIGVMKPYIKKYREMKERSEKGTLDYLWSKKMQNACYGRFGLNPISEEIQLEFDHEVLKWLSTESINDDNDAYLPYAMFVTAHARRRLLEYVNQVPVEDLIHADTDSVIHKGDPLPTIDYGKELGQWDIEQRPIRMYEGGFKRYVEVLSDDVSSLKHLSVACAGVSQKKNENDVPIGAWVEILDNPQIITTNNVIGRPDYKIKSEWLRKIYLDNNMNPDCVNTYMLKNSKVIGGTILKETQIKLNDNMRFRLRRGG